MTDRTAFRRYFKVGFSPYKAIALDWVPSWDQYHYPRFGAWRHNRGLTLRFRGWLLLMWWRA